MKQKRSEGAVSPFVLVALLALLAASALALDAGVLWTARTQLQGTVDASALAAAANLIDPTGPAVTADAAVDAAATLGRSNRAVPATSVELAEVRIGHWDPQARAFDAGVDLGDPELVNAVDVRARLDGASNRAVPAFMARVLGRDSFTVSASATAWLGFAGSAEPGLVDLPIAIDCCSIQGSPACANDFCPIASPPPNHCDVKPTLNKGSGLQQFDDDGHPVSCLDLNPTGAQNACWTNFEPPGTNINKPLLLSLVKSGNAFGVEAGDVIELDQGVVTPVFEDIADRFDAEGTDRYRPFDGNADSWVVRLPVVSCQQGSPSCDKGEITGFVCFELRQIEVNPAKMLRGRFLCPVEDAGLFADCALGGSIGGGDDFGIHAEIPVLVR